jgi:very-short-patch-repair endonuclease
MIEAARGLRQRQTPAEKKLWGALRDRRLVGLKFRRQHPYGPFILDAFCVEYQLEVEIDGGGHDDAQQATYDVERTEYLKLHGVHVLRFTNDDVENNFRDVLRQIVEATRKQLNVI